jgi:hypothetical protein
MHSPSIVSHITTLLESCRPTKLVLEAAMLLGVRAVQNALHTFPQITADHQLVLARVDTPIPFELAVRLLSIFLEREVMLTPACPR